MAIIAVRPVALGRSDCDRIAFRLIVSEVVPGDTAFTAALAYRSPLALRDGPHLFQEILWSRAA
jgi:hypothetical protein